MVDTVHELSYSGSTLIQLILQCVEFVETSSEEMNTLLFFKTAFFVEVEKLGDVKVSDASRLVWKEACLEQFELVQLEGRWVEKLK